MTTEGFFSTYATSVEVRRAARQCRKHDREDAWRLLILTHGRFSSLNPLTVWEAALGAALLRVSAATGAPRQALMQEVRCKNQDSAKSRVPVLTEDAKHLVYILDGMVHGYTPIFQDLLMTVHGGRRYVAGELEAILDAMGNVLGFLEFHSDIVFMIQFEARAIMNARTISDLQSRAYDFWVRRARRLGYRIPKR